MWKGEDHIEKYVVRAKIGQGVACYQFDSKNYALEIIEQLKKDGIEFTANFNYE